jgi:hypothetical protein
MTTKIIRREPLTDSQKFQILDQYALGIPVATIAASVSRDTSEISKLVNHQLYNMTAIKETRLLIGNPCSSELRLRMGKAPTKFITTAFLDLLEDKAEAYAYYYAQTGDNKFSLIQSGLDIGIAQNLNKNTKDYVMRIRGQFIRDMPPIKKFIQEEQDRRVKEYRVEKAQIQMELVNQVEELKELVVQDPKQRTNLLKSIEMLGRTIGAFTDRVEVEETDARSGLSIILEKAKREAKGITSGSYTIEDSE